MKRNPIRPLFAAALSAALLCMSAYAFTPETVETPSEPIVEDENAALTEVTSELLFYQDFDNIPVGTYESGDIASLLSGTEANKLVDYGKMGWGVIGSGCTFEVLEEEDGNHYLKVTGTTYKAFGVWFDNSDLKYAVMSFNYKFPASTGYKTLNSAAYSAQGAMFVGGTGDGKTGNWTANNALMASTATEWTQFRNHSYVQSPCVGFGFNQSAGEGEIYLDDITVWSFSTRIDDASEPAHKSAVAKTISFKNSNGYEDAEMPADITRYVWYNFYNGQSKPVTVDLSSFAPSSAPAGYEFAGWSATDGGLKIKDCQYNAYKVPGDFTFYALWQKAKPVVMQENFDDYEVGTVLTSSDLEFLQLNQFGSADFTATVVLDETTGSKVLKIAGSKIYSGFALKNRGRTAEKEYVTFDYRFDSADGSRLVIYSGASHEGSYHQGTVSRQTAWSNLIFGSNPANNVFGFFFDRNDGNYVMYLDNIYYWYIPAGLEAEDKQVTVTFANSTGSPVTAAMPEKLTKTLWENADDKNNTINLELIAPTDVTGGYRFAGWSRTDGGKVISVNYKAHRIIADETLYAIWEKVDAPALLDTVSIRTGGVQGMRFKASVHNAALTAENAEIGFIVTRAKFFDQLDNDESLFNFDDLGSVEKAMVSGISFKKADGVIEINKLMDEEDTSASIFAAVLTGIPESKENYTEKIYIRAYMKLDGVTYYGNVKNMSLYEAALAVKNTEGYETTDFVERILEICQ